MSATVVGLPFVLLPKPDLVQQDCRTFEVAVERPYIYCLYKLGVEANRRGKGANFATAVCRLIFSGTENWDQGDDLAKAARYAVGLLRNSRLRPS